MSADPDAPTDQWRYSGGHVIRNMIYTHDTKSDNLSIVTGWESQGVREYDQELVRPCSREMDRRHPCYTLNKELLTCSLSCPAEMKLGGRTAVCNVPRQALMRCLVKHKNWDPTSVPPQPWYLRWR